MPTDPASLIAGGQQSLQAPQSQSQGVTASATAAASAGSKGLGNRDTFLKLFLTQLRNQDPTSPRESKKLVQELATFSQVEQTQKMNEKIGTILEKVTDTNVRDHMTFIGRSVVADDNRIQLKDGDATLNYRLAGPADNVEIRVKNGKDETVAKLDGSTEAGTNTVTWDGVGEDGKSLEDGTYRIDVAAKTSDGTEVQAKPFIQDTVTSVRMAGDTIELELARGGTIQPSDVTAVSTTSEGAAPATG